MSEPEFKILLVGKPGPLRNALASLIAAMRLDHLITADGGLLALRMVREIHLTCVLLASGLPDAEAVELVRQIKHDQPTVRLLALADSEQQRQQLFAAGADSVLPTGISFSHINSALREIMGTVPPKRTAGGSEKS